MNQNDEIIGASPERWWVGALLSYLGIVNGFTTLVFVTINGLLVEYFDVNAKLIDWLYLGNACGSILFGVFMGTLSKCRSVTLKSWFLEALLLDIVCFTAVIAAFLEKRLLPLMFVGIFLNGFSIVTVMSLVPITASVWFREKEQATLYGVGNAAVLVGNGAAAIVPSIFLGRLADGANNMHRFEIVMVVIFAIICVMCVVATMATWKFLPDLPRFPPTLVEARRLQVIDRSPNKGIFELFKDFLRELYILATDRTSIFLIFAYDIALTALVFHFMYLPGKTMFYGNDDHLNSVLAQNANKAYMLSSFSAGGILGSISFGKALDKLKSYRTIACVLGVCTPLFSVLLFICYWFNILFLPYVAIFLFGACIGPTMSFCGEILKQYIYPCVTEITQGIACNCSSYILQLVLSQIFRYVIDRYGTMWFFLMDFLLCLCLPLLLLSINPPLNRFNYQSLPGP